MKTKIVVPILTSKESWRERDTGGSATVGGRARKAISDQVESLGIEADSLDQVIASAVKVLNLAVASSAKPKGIQVDTMTIHVGVSAGGSVGILGTGVDVEAEASFEITFKVVGA